MISIKDDENHMALTLTECVRLFPLGSDELWTFEKRKPRVNFPAHPYTGHDWIGENPISIQCSVQC